MCRRAAPDRTQCSAIGAPRPPPPSSRILRPASLSVGRPAVLRRTDSGRPVVHLDPGHRRVEKLFSGDGHVFRVTGPQEADVVLRQPRDREPGVLPSATGPVSAATRNSTAPCVRPSDEGWLMTTARERWSRNASRSKPWPCNEVSNFVPEGGILYGYRLRRDDRWD